MITKSNIIAFATVFRTASIFDALGGIAALFLRDSKTDMTQHHAEPMEI